MFRRIIANNTQRLNDLVLKITCLAWLAAKLIGWRMFTTYRLFPTAPVFDLLDKIPLIVHTVLFGISIALLLLLLFVNKNKTVLWILLGVESLSFLLDQNRLQPWDYQYMFMIFIFAVNYADCKLFTTGFAFILISTYVYSGLGKLNTGFVHLIWTKMLLQMFLKIPAGAAAAQWLSLPGYLVGVVELLLGICLLFANTRKPAAWLLIAMHVFILVFLGPWGLKYNRIVWPWNLAMISFLFLVFLKKDQTGFQFKYIFCGWNKLVFICWGILPALNFAGYWDNYLSSGIYSGKLPLMVICIKDTAQCKPLRRFSKHDNKDRCSSGSVIDLQYWAMAETNMAPYPEIRAYKKIQSKLEKQYPTAGLTFIYFANGTPGR